MVLHIKRLEEIKEIETMLVQKGFTLIELLVVIAIIAILMSILMPFLSMKKGAGSHR
jgi:prepilin-type N-terminal cleavage/methylation domain-containing protein